MATGTPVVTSDAGALVEVVGDAGIQTPALDVAALAAALVRVTQGAELRRDLRARGLERAKRFSWARAAEETFAVLERAGR
jgi:glycosyltransferase involved in cell wall biosynthesis